MLEVGTGAGVGEGVESMGGVAVGIAVGSRPAGAAGEFEGDAAGRVGVAGCVVGGDGVVEGEGEASTAGTVAATASPEAGDGLSPEASSESVGAGS